MKPSFTPHWQNSEIQNPHRHLFSLAISGYILFSKSMLYKLEKAYMFLVFFKIAAYIQYYFVFVSGVQHSG